MEFRKATEADLSRIAQIYEQIHTAEENGQLTVGWARNVYPTYDTAKASSDRDDLFVAEDEGTIVGTAIINQLQPDSYPSGNWRYCVSEDAVMVLHTLAIDPQLTGRGYGKQFVRFYEEFALSKGCPYLRMDTQIINTNARALYRKLGYEEIGTVPCTFNGIEGVQLVLLEKKL